MWIQPLVYMCDLSRCIRKCVLFHMIALRQTKATQPRHCLRGLSVCLVSREHVLSEGCPVQILSSLCCTHVSFFVWMLNVMRPLWYKTCPILAACGISLPLFATLLSCPEISWNQDWKHRAVLGTVIQRNGTTLVQLGEEDVRLNWDYSNLVM